MLYCVLVHWSLNVAEFVRLEDVVGRTVGGGSVRITSRGLWKGVSWHSEVRNRQTYHQGL